MAFNPTCQEKFPCLFHAYPALKPRIPTMFPSPTSVLIPPPHKNPLFNHTSTFHHFHDHNPTLLMEGFFSVSHPFNVPPVPFVGESSHAAMSLSGFVNPNINPVKLEPNNKIEALYEHQGGTFMSDLEKKAVIQSSAVFASAHSQMGPSLSEHKIEALYGHQGGTFMSDLEKKAAVQSSAVFASAHSQMGPSLSEHKIEALYGHQGGTFMSDLEKKAAVQSSAVFASAHSQMGPSLSEHKIEALYGHQGGTFMSDLEKKAAIQSTAVFASAHSQMGPSLSKPPVAIDYDDLRSVMRDLHAEDLSYLPEIYDINHDGEKMKSVQEERDNNTASVTKGLWSAEEDRDLVKLVNQYGQKRWSQVAKVMEKRTGKQCRDRWNNHLRPDIEIKKPWTMKEDIILIICHKKHGNKWVEIAKSLPGRSANTVKNRWNGAKRRRNIFKKKNDAYEGAILQAYIKRVTAAKEAGRDSNE